MPPPPEYSHSFAQTTDEHDNATSKRLSQIASLQDVDEDADVTNENVPYPEASPGDLIHPSDFRPFFTLIEDPSTGEHHHPGIHYIFSDDDPDFLTTAIIDNHALQSELPSPAQNNERMVLVDIAPDGKTVIDAQSLSSDWQVASTLVSQAPSWNETDQGGKRDGGLMLAISGTESRERPIYQHRKSSQDGMIGRIETVAAGCQERLAVLDKLIKRNLTDQDAAVQGLGVDVVSPTQ